MESGCISLDNYRPITLEQMSAVKLMNRIDTKFVTNRRLLMRLLSMAEKSYFAQEIDGKRVASYHTLYFDTASNTMYNAHQNGKKNRQKLRVRSYVDSDQHFLEVKTKNNHGRTKKKRVQMEGDSLQPYFGFLNERLWLNPEDMLPKIENNFHRITLVNDDMSERLTIDHDLSFHNLETDNSVSLDDVVIIELKRDGLKPSPILPILNELRIFPMGFSKYCIGMAMTNPSLKWNRFKERIRTITNKIINK